MNASDDALQNAAGSAEKWGHGCAGFVVLGVIAEVILAICHPSYDSFWEQWGTALSDVLIAVGIAGEVLLAARQSTCQSVLQRRSNDRIAEVEFSNGFLEDSAAKAMERAAKAERETERLRLQFGWREFSVSEKARLISELTRLRTH